MRWRTWWLRCFLLISGFALPALAANADPGPALLPPPPPGTTSTGAVLGDPTSKARAQEHVDRGNQLLDERALAKALAEFRLAYAIFPSPKILYNQAQVEREMGRFVDAAAHYDAFMKGVTGADQAEVAQRVENARAAARDVRAKIAFLEARAGSGVDLMIDGRPCGKLPLTQALPLDPGRHLVEFRGPGLVDQRREIVLASGEHQQVVAVPAILSAPEETLAAAAPPPRRSVFRRWPFWVVSGTVLLVGGAAAIYAATHVPYPKCPSMVFGCVVDGGN